jgi:hypothetical protein
MEGRLLPCVEPGLLTGSVSTTLTPRASRSAFVYARDSLSRFEAHLKQLIHVSVLERSGPVRILEPGGERHNRSHKDLRQNLRLLRLALRHPLDFVQLLLSQPLIDDAIPSRSALDPLILRDQRPIFPDFLGFVRTSLALTSRKPLPRFSASKRRETSSRLRLSPRSR